MSWTHVPVWPSTSDGRTYGHSDVGYQRNLFNGDIQKIIRKAHEITFEVANQYISILQYINMFL